MTTGAEIILRPGGRILILLKRDAELPMPGAIIDLGIMGMALVESTTDGLRREAVYSSDSASMYDPSIPKTNAEQPMIITLKEKSCRVRLL